MPRGSNIIMSDTLHRALLGPDDVPRNVDRIEFEVLDGGRLRWTLWDGPARLHSASIAPDEMCQTLVAAGVILDANSQARRDEASEAAEGN